MIRVDPELCSGCRQCEVACSSGHFKGMTGRLLSRVQVVKMEEIGADVPVICQQCHEQYCVDVCPVQALQIGDRGEVLVDIETCTGCGLCEKACPIGAIRLVDQHPLVCDLCGGSPRCVEACTMGALSFEPETSGVVLPAEVDTTLLSEKTTQEKGYHYGITMVETLRKTWVANVATDPDSDR